MLFYGFVVFFVYFLFPAEALAWGPGTHMSYGLEALAQVALLAPSIRVLLKKYPNEFLYGNIAADIIFAKKFAGDLYHCHNWEVAFSLLKNAKKDQERAFIFGYLGHLSIDTVAHNFFIPLKIISSFESRTLRHNYWEMRFDEKMDPQVWVQLKEIAEGDYVDLDRFLERNLKRTLFSFSTNKKIFNSLLLIQRMNQWRRASSLLAKTSSFRLYGDEVREFKDLCFEVMIEFLKNPKDSRAIQADPSGKLKLLYAKEMVRDLRKYYRRGLVQKWQIRRFIKEIKVRLGEGLFKPVDLPLVTDVLG